MISECPTPRQIILRLHLVIKKNFRQGKGISDIIKMREIKKIQKQYNNSTGYILNNYQLKRIVKFDYLKINKLI